MGTPPLRGLVTPAVIPPLAFCRFLLTTPLGHVQDSDVDLYST